MKGVAGGGRTGDNEKPVHLVVAWSGVQRWYIRTGFNRIVKSLCFRVLKANCLFYNCVTAYAHMNMRKITL